MIRNVLVWLEETARRAPDATAFESETGSMTFGDLLKRAREIGTFLAGIIPPQKPVAVYMDKSPSCIEAIMGAVYAGCFYTPVDPTMPPRRTEMIFSVLQPKCVLCEKKYLENVSKIAGEVLIVTVEDVPKGEDSILLKSVFDAIIDTDLLYVLFTSGSTGVPKGVAITHRAVIDFIEWACSALGIDEGCRFGNQAPLYFDNSVLDVYCTLRMGACVQFIPEKYFLFPGKLMKYLDEKRINTIFWVPSVLVTIANAGVLEETIPCALERVYFCGEVMPCKQLNRWRKALPSARFINMYGPTEITDVCAYYEVAREFGDHESLPIGHACANSRILLLDGEICVTGTCLSPGYYNAPERTRESFVINPMRPEIPEIIYKTGDLGICNERGELMFLGRRDSQIKRHGFRIELGEIESVLLATEGVSEGCCHYDLSREKIVCVFSGTIQEKALKGALKEKLPRYMLPDDYCCTNSLPKTGNGKLDRMRIKWEYEHEHFVT